MPIYEYECARCETEFEVEQRITDDPLKYCPNCRSKRVKRLISRTSFALRGGGWYADGYGSSSASNSTGDAGKSSGDSAGTSSSEGSSGSEPSKSGEKSSGSAKGKKAVA